MNRLLKILTWLSSFVILFAGVAFALAGVTTGATVLTVGVLLILLSVAMNVYVALEIAKPA